MVSEIQNRMCSICKCLLLNYITQQLSDTTKIFIVTKYQLVTLIGKQIIQMSMSGSLVSVHNHFRNTPPDFTKCSVHVDVAVVRSSSGSIIICYVITSGFLDDVMFSSNGSYSGMTQS